MLKQKPGPKSTKKKTVSPAVNPSATSAHTTSTDLHPPAYFSPRARRIWSEQREANTATLTPANAALFAAYCQQIEVIENCTEALADGEYTVLNGVGTPVERAEVRTLQGACKLLLSYGRQLGLTNVGATRTTPDSDTKYVTINGHRVEVQPGGSTDPEVIKRRARLDAMMHREEPPAWALDTNQRI